MDCIDCHNMAAHRITPSAEQAVDAALASGGISQRLPFVRRESVRLVKAEYSSQEQALPEIAKGLRAFYTGRGAFDRGQLARSIASLQNVYRHNVFPPMKVTFGVYPDNIGAHNVERVLPLSRRRSHGIRPGPASAQTARSCHMQVDQPASAVERHVLTSNTRCRTVPCVPCTAGRCSRG